MLDQFLWGHSSRVCDISCCCFFQAYHEGQLSLLSSISGLRVLSERCVLSSVTENQWQGENNLYESMYPY